MSFSEGVVTARARGLTVHPADKRNQRLINNDTQGVLMRKPMLILGAVIAVQAPLLLQQASPAAAATSITIRSGDGDTLRARFYEHANFTGAVLSYYGSSACSATTTDTDFRLSSLPAGWNDVISSVRDYNGCDVKLYQHTNFTGSTTGYVNYSSGRNLSSIWNDQASSFKVS